MSPKNWFVSFIVLVLFHSAMGCTASGAKSDAGTGGYATAGANSDAGTGDSPCPWGCPAPHLGIYLVVTAAADGGALSGVNATLSSAVTDGDAMTGVEAGSTTVTMSCESNNGAMVCDWPSSGYPIAGTYSLLVTAPGFRSANVSATLTYTPDPRCGCGMDTLQPSTVTLDPS